MDSLSGWTEFIRVCDEKTETIKQILRVIFSRNGVPKIFVSNNAPEFCEVGLCTELRKIECTPYKTPPYHLQSNWIVERMARTVKMGLKAFEPFRDLFTKSFDIYRSIPHAGKVQSPSALIGRQIRTITMSFSTNEKI